MLILLERLSVVRESLEVCSIRDFIFGDGIREGDGMFPEVQVSQRRKDRRSENWKLRAVGQQYTLIRSGKDSPERE
jgi:hypothetical protein